MTSPTATAGMLIRCPVPEVFNAFVDPAVTTRFWFTHSTGWLAPEAEVRWTWAMYGATTDVRVKEFEPNRRILMEWDVDSSPTEVEWIFQPHADGTFVDVVNRGFASSSDQVANAIESAGGFALVLAAAKFWLEHGIRPTLIEDRHPSAHVSGWVSAS
ncbi:SRPBCC domain-containing protein [Microvirga pudoricolor]|uniref:SRPBCC domain-containing protein n=1 Tax=Microvirga pudoricolor TaxID=2778729 RepID=UPI0019506C14|nr:SRPBCC domain-containing protein [Microvirga pudoricolor]MBM6593731.1 SRPBCC domain-containing protein [Microvirga pudoricolor]